MDQSLGTPIAGILGTTDFVLSLGFDDLTDDLARRVGRSGTGSSMAWQLGHMLHYRHLMLKLLGVDRADPFEEPFGRRGAATDGNYPSVAELRASWQAVSAALTPLVAGRSSADLAAPMRVGQGAHGEQSVMDKLLFYVWHEAYHAGQLGALRVECGLPAFSTLVARNASRQA